MTTPEQPARPWLKRKAESAKAYAAAKVYFELGASRTLDAAAKLLGYRGGTALDRWAATHEWSARASAWDTHKAEVEEKARVEALQARARKRAEEALAAEDADVDLGKALRERAQMMLKFPLSEAKTTSEQVTDAAGNVVEVKNTTIKPAKWQFRDAALIADTASKLTRRGLGLDEERVANTLSGPNGGPVQVHASVSTDYDLSRLPTEDLEAMERILAKAKRPDADPQADA